MEKQNTTPWQEILLKKCYDTLPSGGEVRIQFSIRKNSQEEKIVPIIRAYPCNQTICEEIILS